jgi:hypothetical protein
VKTNRILLGCSLIATLLVSALAFPSLGIRNPPAAAKGQEEPLVSGQLVQVQTRDGELSKHFRKYDLIRMDPHAVAAQVRNKGRLLLKSSIRDFDMEMTPHDLRSPDYSAQVIDANGVAHPLPQPEVNTFKGFVKGLPDAYVRMALTEKGIEGAIITREKRYFLQPARSISKESRADDFVLYDSADVNKDDGICGVTLADEVAARAGLKKSSTTKVVEAEATFGPVLPLTPLKVARISTDADGEYVASIGGASQTNAHILDILNLVEGIYEFEIGMTFQIVQQNAWENASSDPYTASEAGALLTQFSNHWNANFPNSGSNSRSVAHLFTGRNLDGFTIGIAALTAACRNPDSAYGLSQQLPFGSISITAQTVNLTAHEIGHNFGAFHTNEIDSEVPFDLERSCENTIMEAFIGDGPSFCPFSRSQVSGHANAHSSCLTTTAASPPSFPDCVTTPISFGVARNGNLASGDCRSPSRGVAFFADRYSFSGTAGQRVFITMNASGGLDTYLYLIGPDGYFVTQNDDINLSNTNSRIPATGIFTLPMSGVYILEATSFGGQQTGSYTITVNNTGCTISATVNNTHFGAGGGNGTVNVTLNGCSGANANYAFSTFPSSASWLDPETTSTSGSRPINFTVAQNSNQAGRRAFLLIGPVTIGQGPNDVAGGLRIPITQSGTRPDCVPTPIAFGQTLNGNLSTSDCHSPVRGNNFFADRYTFNALAGQKVAIQATAAIAQNPDTYLALLGPNGAVVMIDDDSGGNITNSRIPGGTKSLTLGLEGIYTIEVTAFEPSATGSYSVRLTTDATGNTVQFSQSSFNVTEGPNSLTVTVNRTGDSSGAATVDYVTSDTAGSNLCSTNTGAASSRCDYLRTAGTLRFAPGETSKTILIPIIDDVYAEGAETLNILLSNVNGATLGTAAALITINDNDASTGTNPIGNSGFFVRQHYIDFLNREPDTVGFNFWVNEIASCGANAACIDVKRVNVSAAFFLSIEFQETGYLVYRTYKSAFGNIFEAPVPVRLNEFLRDTQQIGQGVQVNVGNWEQQLEANKQSFALAFVQRPGFLAAYPNSMTATAFVSQLNTRAGGVLSAGEQANLINSLAPPSDAVKRAQVLRAVAEDPDLKAAEFNKAFVLMQYFGYLRRNPNEAPDANFNGFNFWLDKLNQFNGNFINAEMVKAFITSIEYQQRFGP